MAKDNDFAFRKGEPGFKPVSSSFPDHNDHWEGRRAFVKDTVDKNPGYGYRKIKALARLKGANIPERDVRDLLSEAKSKATPSKAKYTMKQYAADTERARKSLVGKSYGDEEDPA